MEFNELIDEYWREHRTFSKFEACIDIQRIDHDHWNTPKSFNAWGNRWKWSRGKVKRFMEMLEEMDIILLGSKNNKMYISLDTQIDVQTETEYMRNLSFDVGTIWKGLQN